MRVCSENNNCMRVDKSWAVRVCSENNNCMRVDKSWPVRVYIENNNCMRVDKSWPVRVCSENNNCMRYIVLFVETPRKFITAVINLRGVSTNKTIYILSPCKPTKNLIA